MKLIPTTTKALALALQIGVASGFLLAPSWAQSPYQYPGSPASPANPYGAPGASAPNSMGVWHRFGQAGGTPVAPTAPPVAPSAPVVQPTQYGVWRHFGTAAAVPARVAPPAPSAPTDLPVQPVAPPPVAPAPPPMARDVPPTPPSTTMSGTRAMEQEMWEMVNRDRADPANAQETQGRALPLRWNERLAQIARAHSLDMLNQGYFAHEDPQGRSVATRLEEAGIPWQAVGENIAIYGNVGRAEAAFMNEPRSTKNHRGNILSTEFTDIGIGVVQGPDGRLYITQDFYAGPR